MLFRKFNLPNKPLAMVHKDRVIYMGDAHGFVYELSYPFVAPKVIFQSSAPISSLVVSSEIYYGDWDGGVGTVSGKNINLGVHMVKSMLVHRGLIYVSIGLCVYVLDLHLNVRCCYEVEHKVLSMTSFESKLYCGMGVPFIAQIDSEIKVLGRSLHDTSMLCMHGEYTGSADGKILKQNYADLSSAELFYRGESWIRSIHNQYLFSDGRHVIADVTGLKEGKEGGRTIVYSHDSDVISVTRSGNKIISIGLDYCYCVLDIEASMTPEEERELAELMD